MLQLPCSCFKTNQFLQAIKEIMDVENHAISLLVTIDTLRKMTYIYSLFNSHLFIKFIPTKLVISGTAELFLSMKESVFSVIP